METFLVRVFLPADERSRGEALRGLVRHVATGTETAFVGDEEVLDLLRHAPTTRASPRGHPAEGDGRGDLLRVADR
jgi:hypothetical protein